MSTQIGSGVRQTGFESTSHLPTRGPLAGDVILTGLSFLSYGRVVTPPLNTPLLRKVDNLLF